MPASNYRMNWDDVKIKTLVSGSMLRNLRVAGLFLQGEIRKSINRGNPTGDDPSAPGEAPKKVSAQLFDSIAVTEPYVDGTVLRIVVGTNKVYARRLEFGFFGTDSLGRNVHQEARPFLRPGLYNNTSTIARIALTGRK